MSIMTLPYRPRVRRYPAAGSPFAGLSRREYHTAWRWHKLCYPLRKREHYTRVKLRARVALGWRMRYGAFPTAAVLDWIMPLTLR